MKYMLMMNGPVDSYEQFGAMSREDVEAHIAFMRTFAQRLGESGELVSAEGLEAPTEAKLVRAAADGSPLTDGVFAETKEFLAGYWIVEVDSPERAYAIAAEASMAPGRAGEPMRMAIEVREVASGPPERD